MKHEGRKLEVIVDSLEVGGHFFKKGELLPPHLAKAGALLIRTGQVKEQEGDDSPDCLAIEELPTSEAER